MAKLFTVGNEEPTSTMDNGVYKLFNNDIHESKPTTSHLANDDSTVERRENKHSSTNSQEKMKPVLIITVIAVALGTNFGIYNSSVVNNLEPAVWNYINETQNGMWISSDIATVWSVVVSAFTAGTAIGTLCSPFLAEYLGRKRGLIFSAGINVVGSLLCGFYMKVFELALVGRLLQGMSLGTGLPLASAFVTEISPIKYRGVFNALLQTAFGLGDLCGMLFSTSALLGTIELSHFCLAITLIPASFQIIVLIFSYETPRYLVLKQKNVTKGKKALQYYQGKAASVSAMNEIMEEKGVPADEKTQEKQKITFTNFWSSEARKPIILACLLLATNGFTGVSPIMSYSTLTFNESQLPKLAELCTVTLGVCNFLGSFVALFLTDILGRKKLFAIGIYGCFAAITSFTIFSCVVNYVAGVSLYIGYGMVVSLDCFLLFFSLVGASANTLAAEICSQKYRSIGVSLANFFNMLVSTTLILLYAPIDSGLGHPWVFLPASCISVCLGTYLLYSVPETAGKSLSDIKQHFSKDNLVCET